MGTGKRRYQILLTSTQGTIDVFLVNRAQDGWPHADALSAQSSLLYSADAASPEIGKPRMRGSSSSFASDAMVSQAALPASPLLKTAKEIVDLEGLVMDSPQLPDDYFFTLQDGEGITDLYDLDLK